MKRKCSGLAKEGEGSARRYPKRKNRTETHGIDGAKKQSKNEYDKKIKSSVHNDTAKSKKLAKLQPDGDTAADSTDSIKSTPRKTSRELPVGIERSLLFKLDDDLIQGTLLCRPSKRNKSPYVGDILIEPQNGEPAREAIVHLPNLDMGGKCRVGTKLLCKPARDRKGNKVDRDAVNPKYGTPKCEFIAQLLHVDESAWHASLYPPVWVGAHPSLGEKIALTWLQRGMIYKDIENIQAQVSNPYDTKGVRFDFLVTHSDKTQRIVEVKTVVDTDYTTSAPPQELKCSFLCDDTPYQRTGIFPWGNSKQKGPDGEAVVSARAIHHVSELTRLQKPATMLFVVIRGDAKRFRPNAEACPSFVSYLKKAKESGVDIIARNVQWGATADSLGCCYDGEDLPIQWPFIRTVC